MYVLANGHGRADIRVLMFASESDSSFCTLAKNHEGKGYRLYFGIAFSQYFNVTAILRVDQQLMGLSRARGWN